MIKDNSKQVLDKLTKAAITGANAAGEAAVGIIIDQMEKGYHDVHKTRNQRGEVVGEHTAIRDTGDLERDVKYQVLMDDKYSSIAGNTAMKDDNGMEYQLNDYSGENDTISVHVGNTLEYAVHVHEGTSKLKGRPYIKDAIMKNTERLFEVWKAYLAEGMK